MHSGESGRPRRVLVVDDDSSIREMITMALEEDGFEVVCAPEGESALAMIPDVAPGVILLDTRMPVMDGWEFARRYQELPDHSAPVIILSAVDDPELTAGDMGADGFLPKPFDLNDLTDTVNQFFQQTD